MTQEIWDPVAEPWRVVWTYNTTQIGCYGWSQRVSTFRTEAEARAAMDKPFGDRVTTRCDVQVAVNAETWMKNGRWQRIASRGRRKKTAA
jgi:hypothetical protein